MAQPTLNLKLNPFILGIKSIIGAAATILKKAFDFFAPHSTENDHHTPKTSATSNIAVAPASTPTAIDHSYNAVSSALTAATHDGFNDTLKNVSQPNGTSEEVNKTGTEYSQPPHAAQAKGQRTHFGPLFVPTPTSIGPRSAPKPRMGAIPSVKDPVPLPTPEEARLALVKLYAP